MHLHRSIYGSYGGVICPEFAYVYAGRIELYDFFDLHFDMGIQETIHTLQVLIIAQYRKAPERSELGGYVIDTVMI